MRFCFDCGLNGGVYTVLVARTGAIVHAFEPDLSALTELRKRARQKCRDPRDRCSDIGGAADLLFYANHEADPVHFSQGASLRRVKRHLGEQSQRVSDRSQSLRVAVPVAPNLEDGNRGCRNRGTERDGSRAFVELHVRKIAELKILTDALRARLAPWAGRFDLRRPEQPAAGIRVSMTTARNSLLPPWTGIVGRLRPHPPRPTRSSLSKPRRNWLAEFATRSCVNRGRSALSAS